MLSSQARLDLVVGGLVAVGLLARWVLVPRRLLRPVPAEVLKRLSERERLEVDDRRVELQNEMRTTALQAIAGLAVLAGAFLGFQQLTEDRQQSNATLALTLEGQASERFTRAIDQLGSDRLEVRIGGIYGLEQIARQAPDNRLAVTQVLVAYLHRRIPRPAMPPSDSDSTFIRLLAARAPDAQAALSVLGRRQTAPTDPPLDLHGLELGGADLSGSHLEGTNLFGADLRGVDLGGADLRSANLDNADLRDAGLFPFPDLAYTDLIDADLRGLHLSGAKLQGAYLVGADLRGAHLVTADLRGANLVGADLRGANLGGADLEAANLNRARADQDTAWTAGFDWQGAGIQMERGSTAP